MAKKLRKGFQKYLIIAASAIIIFIGYGIYSAYSSGTGFLAGMLMKPGINLMIIDDDPNNYVTQTQAQAEKGVVTVRNKKTGAKTVVNETTGKVVTSNTTTTTTSTATAGYICDSSGQNLVLGTSKIYCPGKCVPGASTCTPLKTTATCGTIGDPVGAGSWVPTGGNVTGTTERECILCQVDSSNKGTLGSDKGVARQTAKCADVMKAGEKAVIPPGLGEAYTGLPKVIADQISTCFANKKLYALGSVDEVTQSYCGPKGGWIKAKDGKSAGDLFKEAMDNLCASDKTAGLVSNGSSCVKEAVSSPSGVKTTSCSPSVSSTGSTYTYCKDDGSRVTTGCPSGKTASIDALKSGKTSQNDVCVGKETPKCPSGAKYSSNSNNCVCDNPEQVFRVNACKSGEACNIDSQCQPNEKCMFTPYGGFCQATEKITTTIGTKICDGSTVAEFKGSSWAKSYCAYGCQKISDTNAACKSAPTTTTTAPTAAQCPAGTKAVSPSTSSTASSYNCVPLSTGEQKALEIAPVISKCDGNTLVTKQGDRTIVNKKCDYGCNSSVNPNACKSKPPTYGNDESSVSWGRKRCNSNNKDIDQLNESTGNFVKIHTCTASCIYNNGDPYCSEDVKNNGNSTSTSTTNTTTAPANTNNDTATTTTTVSKNFYLKRADCENGIPSTQECVSVPGGYGRVPKKAQDSIVFSNITGGKSAYAQCLEKQDKQHECVEAGTDSRGNTTWKLIPIPESPSVPNTNNTSSTSNQPATPPTTIYSNIKGGDSAYKQCLDYVDKNREFNCVEAGVDNSGNQTYKLVNNFTDVQKNSSSNQDKDVSCASGPLKGNDKLCNTNEKCVWKYKFLASGYYCVPNSSSSTPASTTENVAVPSTTYSNIKGGDSAYKQCLNYIETHKEFNCVEAGTDSTGNQTFKLVSSNFTDSSTSNSSSASKDVSCAKGWFGKTDSLCSTNEKCVWKYKLFASGYYCAPKTSSSTSTSETNSAPATIYSNIKGGDSAYKQCLDYIDIHREFECREAGTDSNGNQTYKLVVTSAAGSTQQSQTNTSVSSQNPPKSHYKGAGSYAVPSAQCPYTTNTWNGDYKQCWDNNGKYIIAAKSKLRIDGQVCETANQCDSNWCDEHNKCATRDE